MSSFFRTARERRGAIASLVPIALMLLGAGTAPGAEADPATVASLLHGWSPLLHVEFGIHAQELKARGSTTFGAQDGGTNTVSTLLARIETGFMTPPLDSVPGAPRLVLRGGGSIPLRETASTIISSQRIAGGEFGTDIGVSFKDMWHAAVDLRFQLPITEETILIRPGFEYLQSRFRLEPNFTFRAQPTPGNENPPTLDFPSRSDADVQRFVGPTLAVEGNVFRIGLVSIDVYLQGRMYFLIGDRDTVVVHTGTLLNQQETSTARMEANFVAGQVGFGIRGRF